MYYWLLLDFYLAFKLFQYFERIVKRGSIALSFQDLIDDIRGDTSGNFEATLIALFHPPAYFDAWCIKRALKVYLHLRVMRLRSNKDDFTLRQESPPA